MIAAPNILDKSAGHWSVRILQLVFQWARNSFIAPLIVLQLHSQLSPFEFVLKPWTAPRNTQKVKTKRKYTRLPRSCFSGCDATQVEMHCVTTQNEN